MGEKKACAENKKQRVYRLLMVIAGFYGGYAMLVRGGAFSNAQTGNVVCAPLHWGTDSGRKLRIM